MKVHKEDNPFRKKDRELFESKRGLRKGTKDIGKNASKLNSFLYSYTGKLEIELCF